MTVPNYGKLVSLTNWSYLLCKPSSQVPLGMPKFYSFLITLLCAMFGLGGGLLHAQSALVPPDLAYKGLMLESINFTSQTRVTAGQVVVIRANMINTSDQQAEGILVGRVVGQTGEEDRRRVALAANEIKPVDVELRVAPGLKVQSIDIEMTLNVVQGGREVVVQQGDQPVTRTLTLPVNTESQVTAIALDKKPLGNMYWRWPPEKPYHGYELAVASRVDARLTRQCTVLDYEPLPLNQAQWKVTDNLIVSQPSVLKDASTVEALLRFLHTGGRLWVMLDTIDTEAVRDLLGENQQCETISTVELNRFEVNAYRYNLSQAERTVDSDNPIRMKRVVQEGGRVTHSIDGWPVAIWFPVGRGELLLTTLASEAWVTPRPDDAEADPRKSSAYTLATWAAGFANDFQRSKPDLPLNLAEAAYPLERIGNPVVSRALVALVLLGFCGSLAIFGIWKYTQGDLKSIGLAAPAIALVAAVPFIIAAALQRRDIPSMVSILQVAQLEPSHGLLLRETAAVYTNASQSMELAGNADGIAIPSTKMETGVRSFVTEDLYRWKIANTAWPVGTWRYTSEVSVPDKSAVALAKLTEQGLSVELPKQLPSTLLDPVALMVPGSPSLGKSDENRLLIDGEYTAGGDRWTVDTIVTDEQRRRAAIYSELFASTERLDVPVRTLCGWTDLWSDGPQWSTNLERRGTALVMMPIQIETPQVGSLIKIPSSLVSIQHASTQKVSPIFNQTTGKWISESTLSTAADFAFVLPPEAVPLELSSIAIDWDVKAPRRHARLLYLDGGEAIELVQLDEPSIPWKATFQDARLLKTFMDGRLELRIEIKGGEELTTSEKGFVSWQIKHLRVSASGRTLPRNTLVSNSVSAGQ